MTILTENRLFFLIGDWRGEAAVLRNARTPEDHFVRWRVVVFVGVLLISGLHNIAREQLLFLETVLEYAQDTILLGLGIGVGLFYAAGERHPIKLWMYALAFMAGLNGETITNWLRSQQTV